MLPDLGLALGEGLYFLRGMREGDFMSGHTKLQHLQATGRMPSDAGPVLHYTLTCRNPRLASLVNGSMVS
jgi:hypothetical protein